MVLLQVKFNNIYAFNDFSANFSYKKKLVNSSLDNEYLKDFPNIRYKKVNILMGSNGTSKTTFGRAIWKTFLFLVNKEAKNIFDIISNKEKEANIEMDIIFADGVFTRVEIISLNDDIKMRIRKINATKEDTYESLVNKLDDTKQFDNYIKELEGFDAIGFNFIFPSIEKGLDRIHCDIGNGDKNEYASLLLKVVSSFDPSIVKIVPSTELPNTYLAYLHDGKISQITHGDKLSDIKYFSSGTKYAVNIANIIYCIKKHLNGFYYVDEQFSYVNSDIEIACLNVMATLLGDGEQLFFTTHNTEVLALPYPNHSFNFFKKTIDEYNQSIITLINAATLEKRNNVNIKNLYDNDFFDIAPDNNKIFELGE